MNPLDYTFGIEIECWLPPHISHAQVAQALTAAGLRATSETLNHITKSYWKVVTDGSLGDYDRGVEVVSPILLGEAGLDAAEVAFTTLTRLGATITNQCGFHVHVGVGPDSFRPSPPMSFFKRLFKLYAHFEPQIDEFMPPSRRGSSNTYCRTLTRVSPAEVDRTDSIDALMHRLSLQLDQQRYHKLNLRSYARHSTVEFRQHGGTLEMRKARPWIMFCLRMVSLAESGRPLPFSAGAGTANLARPGSKVHLVGELLRRPEGVTQAEALAATGWLKISMPAVSRVCGIPFTLQRTGRITRYYAAVAAAEAGPATLDTLCSALGCTPEETDYFKSRRAYFLARSPAHSTTLAAD